MTIATSNPVKQTLILAVLISMLALGFAYLLEYGFTILPCQLCFWQRYGYFAAILFGIAGLLSPFGRLFAVLAGVCVLSSAGIALYHSAVELGLVPLPQSCGSGFEASTLEELKDQMKNARPSCDQVSFQILGLSLSNLNAIFALLVGSLILISLKRR